MVRSVIAFRLAFWSRWSGDGFGLTKLLEGGCIQDEDSGQIKKPRTMSFNLNALNLMHCIVHLVIQMKVVNMVQIYNGDVLSRSSQSIHVPSPGPSLRIRPSVTNLEFDQGGFPWMVS